MLLKFWSKALLQGAFRSYMPLSDQIPLIKSLPSKKSKFRFAFLLFFEVEFSFRKGLFEAHFKIFSQAFRIHLSFSLSFLFCFAPKVNIRFKLHLISSFSTPIYRVR